MTFRISQNTDSKASAGLPYRSRPTAGNLTGSQRLDVFSSTPIEESYLPGLRPRLQQTPPLFGRGLPARLAENVDADIADSAGSPGVADTAGTDGKGSGDKEGGTIDVGVSVTNDHGSVSVDRNGVTIDRGSTTVDAHGHIGGCSLIGADGNNGGGNPADRSDRGNDLP